MPANKKYLTKSPWVRLSKILAGSIGGYTVMLSLHLLLTRIFPRQDVVVTSFITGYILWAFLLLAAFLAQKSWKVWLSYGGLTVLFTALYLI